MTNLILAFGLTKSSDFMMYGAVGWASPLTTTLATWALQKWRTVSHSSKFASPIAYLYVMFTAWTSITLHGQLLPMSVSIKIKIAARYSRQIWNRSSHPTNPILVNVTIRVVAVAVVVVFVAAVFVAAAAAAVVRRRMTLTMIISVSLLKS